MAADQRLGRWRLSDRAGAVDASGAVAARSKPNRHTHARGGLRPTRASAGRHSTALVSIRPSLAGRDASALAPGSGKAECPTGYSSEVPSVEKIYKLLGRRQAANIRGSDDQNLDAAGRRR